MRPLLVILALILPLALLPSRAPAGNPLAVSVEGPTAMTPGQVGVFYVNVSGGPAELNGTYTLKYWVESSDTSGASPLAASPGEQTGQNKTFNVNVTAPTHEGSIDVIFDTISQNSTANTTVRRTLTVNVLSPIILTASFSNSGGAAVVNTTVRFYVDDVLAGSKVIARINPGDRGTATINWIPVGLAHGQHNVRVEADIDGNGVIDPSKGEVAVFDVFYKTGGEPAPGYLIILGAIIIVIGIVILIAYRRRLKTR